MRSVFDHKRNIRIPADIAKHAAGTDSYLRNSVVTCECGARFALKDSDSSEYCQQCYDEAGEENARIDGAVG